jgi:hypothetical protein
MIRSAKEKREDLPGEKLDQEAVLEGVEEAECLSFGSPPTCYLRGEVRRDGEGSPKIFNCSFLRP